MNFVNIFFFFFLLEIGVRSSYPRRNYCHPLVLRRRGKSGTKQFRTDQMEIRVQRRGRVQRRRLSFHVEFHRIDVAPNPRRIENTAVHSQYFTGLNNRRDRRLFRHFHS